MHRTGALSLLIPFAILTAPRATSAAAFTDPGPPAVNALPATDAPKPSPNPDATFHAAPNPLAGDAVTHDWATFLGPTHNLVSTETRLLKDLPDNGPKVVWEVKRGSGYAAPAISGDRFVMFHRVGGEEVVDCLHRETGERFWRFAYPTNYRDRYGYNDGPRSAPVIAGDWVLTIGAEGKLHCLELATGRVRWSRDLSAEFRLEQNFFGCGATPLVEGGKVIVNVGAPGGPTVAAFDLGTGRMLWGAGTDWGQSYAAPVPANIHGKRRVLVFAGGETPPGKKPTGGLLCIDPENGKVDFAFPWRGRPRESVNGSAPLVLPGENGGNPRVLVSESYRAGGVLLEIAPDFTAKPVWTNEQFGAHFMVPVRLGDHLYGVDGHGPHDAFLVCVDAATGEEAWRTQPEWRETIPSKEGVAREMSLGTYRAWLMPTGDGRVLCLGEIGHLLWVELSPEGYKEVDRARLFLAMETWTPPVLSRGLLYVCQNTDDRVSGAGPRLLCYDLRE